MSVNNVITVAVLGTGRQGRAHARALLEVARDGLRAGDRTYGVKLLLYGRDGAKVKKLAGELGITATTTNLNEAVTSPEVDVVDNCLINSLHYEPLRLAIEHGKHCIAEKPLTGDLSTARSLLAHAAEAGVHHTIIQNMRFQPGPAAVKRMLDEQRLGRVFHARATFGYLVPETVTNRPAWFYQKEHALGGIVSDMMAHFFDLFRWMIGPIESVFCQTGTYLPQRRDALGRQFPVEVEDTAVLALRFANGAMADIFLSWVRRKHEPVPSFEIDGEAGSVIFSADSLQCQMGSDTLHSFSPIRQEEGNPLAGWSSIPLSPANAFRQQLEGFLSAIVTGEPLKPDWYDAVETERLIALAYRSSQEGRTVLTSEAT